MPNKIVASALSIFGVCVFVSAASVFAGSDQKDLTTFLGTFKGQIESLTMVPVVTTFYLDSGTVKGKYRYVDEGAWDHGTLTDIRVLDRDSCGGGNSQAQSGTSQQSQSSAQVVIKEEDDEESVSTLMGAKGKGKKKKKNTAMVQSKFDLCITAMWHDSYGDGPVEFRFNPTRDYFSGLYWNPGEEKAVWNGSNIP
jgi:hypothetical protein